MENKWRASRYGLDGMMIDFGREKELPARELIFEYLDFVDDVLDELECRKEAEYVQTILDGGTGADRQLRVFAETKDLRKVVEYMVAETAADLLTSIRAICCRPCHLLPGWLTIKGDSPLFRMFAFRT